MNREHFLFKRFGRAIARPGWLVVNPKTPFGHRATKERPKHEEGRGWPHVPGTTQKKFVSPKMLDVRDPEKHRPVLNDPLVSHEDLERSRARGQSSKN